MSKHTPGPWYISETGPKWSINVGNGGDSNKHIAMVSCYQEFTNDHTENLANARLIAAAPELYELLEEIVNETIDYTNRTGKDVSWADKAKSIINKIKG